MSEENDNRGVISGIFVRLTVLDLVDDCIVAVETLDRPDVEHALDRLLPQT